MKDETKEKIITGYLVAGTALTVIFTLHISTSDIYAWAVFATALIVIFSCLAVMILAKIGKLECITQTLYHDGWEELTLKVYTGLVFGMTIMVCGICSLVASFSLS